MKVVLTVIILCFISFIAYPQPSQIHDQFLRLEKINSAKTKRLHIGDKIRYKTVQHDWKSAKIEKLDFINQMVYFSSGPVRIEDITAIQSRKQAYWAKYIRLKFQVLGVGVLFFSIFNPLTGLPYPYWALAVGPGAYGLGWLLGKIFEQRYYRIGQKWRLRMMDLSFD